MRLAPSRLALGCATHNYDMMCVSFFVLCFHVWVYQCCVRGENEAIMLLGVGLWTSWVNISGERISLYGKDARIGTSTCQKNEGSNVNAQTQLIPSTRHNSACESLDLSPYRFFWRFRQKSYLNSKPQLCKSLFNKLTSMTPQTNNTCRKLRFSAFQRYHCLPRG